MVFAAGYSSRKKELKEVISEIRSNAAKSSADEWEIEGYNSINDFVEYIKSHELLDLACIDVSNDASVTVAEWIRKNSDDTVIMIFAGVDVSPVKYMKPSIMAASLLLYPYTKEQLEKTVSDLFSYMSAKSSGESEDSFVIKTKDARQHISCDKILYFEARNKKIYLNTTQREYGFYETIDSLADQLPPYFIRCHRSFLINKRKIKSISLSQNIIELENGVTVPLSKSYKSAVKELKYDR
ncbi:MAG: LytTR family DNA-binding domain-containing protein [Eubacteriales bacterium]|nr:LytTR family DNA-binding domain-containing protein [Eubacteriales bacterium]